jgi:hypothetical protein
MESIMLNKIFNETIKTGIRFKMGNSVYSGDLKYCNGKLKITGIPFAINSQPIYDIEVARDVLSAQNENYSTLSNVTIINGRAAIEKYRDYNPDWLIDEILEKIDQKEKVAKLYSQEADDED